MATSERERKHPSGLPFLFFTEFWERFGYYLMIGILLLYMKDVNGLKYDHKEAVSIFSTFIALVYLTPFIGGMLADTWLGYRRSIIIGCLLMAGGYLVMAIPGATAFYTALTLIIVGTGFFKPNISTILGNLYNDPRYRSRKDAGFSIFYMGINLGAFICNFVAAYMRNSASTGEGGTTASGWSLAFSAAGVGMLLGLVVFMLGNRHYVHVDDERKAASQGASQTKLALTLGKILLPAVLFGILGYFLPSLVAGDSKLTTTLLGDHSTDAFIFACIPIVVFFVGLLFSAPANEKRPIAALLSVMAVSVVFWAVFKQNGTTLTVWAENFTDRAIPASAQPVAKPFGMVKKITDKKDTVIAYDYQFRSEKDAKGIVATKVDVNPYLNNLPKDQWPKEGESIYVVNTELFQSINPFFIILLTPVVVGTFQWLRRKRKEPSTAAKIALGTFFAGLSALVMVGAVFSAQNGLTKSSAWWLVGNYFVITIGELCLSPMGLSLVSKLSPPRIAALMMGAWSLSTSIGNKLSGVLASQWDGFHNKEQYFYLNFGILMGATVLLLIMLPWLRRTIKEYAGQ